MFEEELELEKKEGSSFGPLIIIALLAVLIVGGAGVLIMQSRQTLKAEEAAPVVSKMLTERPPTTVKFYTGTLNANSSETPDEPQYKLLQKVGVLKTEKIKKSPDVRVMLTPDGEKMIASLPDTKKTTKDAETEYDVPLATRKLVNVTQVTKLAPNRFLVNYTWQWVPNKLGDDFDASSELVKGFSTWDRQKLIDKCGAAFYHAAPESSSVVLMKSTHGWEVVKD
ncbi:MAG TPA: hypothetical protein VMU24_09090 [Candidatus Acidoferrales bacterium]|nr:hypothetical protein [Candidatus Acidoferrales bacterium]